MKYKKIHFVGVKGVGMAPLAIIAKEAGFEVSGTDIKDKFITDEVLLRAEITSIIGFSEKNVLGADLVITTGAHGGFSNIEVKKAKEMGIKVLTQGEAVGFFMKGRIFKRRFIGISVAGTHGKTTTTAMIATVLKSSGLDPSFLVGTGFIPSLGLPGHYGKGEYFVAEADEYATEPVLDKTAKFLWQHPKIAVVTNIDFDHPDVYDSLADVVLVFSKFVSMLPENGLLIACGDDRGVCELLKTYKGQRITYGLLRSNDFVINNIKFKDGITEFTLEKNDSKLGKFYLSVFGEQNVLNATAAILTGYSLGLDTNFIKKGLLAFKGTKRRAEYIGKLYFGAKLFDDYAHHPTEIKATLKAFRDVFPNKKIVCIFQPHTFSRTRALFKQFITSFNYSDTVILTEIYSSFREKKDKAISSRDLAESIGKLGKDAIFLPELSDVVKYIDKNQYKNDTVLVTMGAGDIYKINSKLKIPFGLSSTSLTAGAQGGQK